MANNGLASILRNLGQRGQELKRDLSFEVLSSATKIELDAKTRVPVDLGKLKQSIYHKMNYAKIVAEVGATEFYAPYVEFGTGGKVEIPNGFADLARTFYVNGKGNMAAQPFLIPAFLDESQKLKDRIEQIVKRYSGR